MNIKIESKRQLVHIGLFVLAFSLKFFNSWFVAILLAVMLFAVVMGIPRLSVKKHLYRQTEKTFTNGAVAYFAVLFAIVLLFPPAVAAVSWAVLAIGDGAATLVGSYFNAKPLPWNKNKTYAGTIAFFFFATAGAGLMLKWMIWDIPSPALLLISITTAGISAVVESLPLKLNDNISVAISAAVIASLLLG